MTDLICEASDVTLHNTRRACLKEALMLATYRYSGSPHTRLLCSHHLDWFMATVNESHGAYDPVSLYPASEAVRVRSV